jgi:U3 small nucleolar RNA-associated protein 4
MSFWDREIHIWRLPKPSQTELDAQNRKLVAKILIKGEANITSVTLSSDGSLLAASTSTDIKLFQLKSRNSGEGDGLRVTKVEVPSSLSGARHVLFSPDAKWLCFIRSDSKILLARLTSTSSIHPQLTKLTRLNRKIEKHILLGGLGTYDRTITRVAFSSDSRILAVSDLAGYVDTFVLEGQEDLSLPILNKDAASSASDSEESESEGEGPRENPIFGQQWTRSPASSSLPKLPATPTVLSFRPSTTPVTNGITHAIATRHNPNPIVHDLPVGEDRLLITTATGDIFEFEVLKGSLSAWSRRNPTISFPEEYRQIKDQARGCIWDVSNSRERAWIYGVGWLFMVDMSRDLPEPDASGQGKKRKRGQESGAGSQILDKELGTGMSRTMRKIVHEEVDEVEDVHFHPKPNDDAMDVDSEPETLALERLRRDDTEGKVNGTGNSKEEGKHWYRTFKYRPILGICQIGEREDGDLGPEVAIVERPIWDVELGPRYAGEQEWERPGV